MSESGKRLDQHLVDLGLAPSRTKAKELIESEQVEIEGLRGFQVITQASFSLKSPAPSVRLRSEELLKFVSRAGLKLESALNYLSLDVNGARCLDIGSSTGGFIDCLLQAGAKEVVGFDVGQGQLHKKLAESDRVTNIEKLNVKEATDHKNLSPQSFDLCTCDLSFISVLYALPVARKCLKPDGELVFLIKPQFELGKKALDKKGIVKDVSLYDDLESLMRKNFEKSAFQVLDYFKSDVKGRDGNQEFFIYAKNN